MNILRIFGFLVVSSCAFGGQINKTLVFKANDLSFQKIKGYDLAILKGFELMHIAGAPMLPKTAVRFLLPAGAIVTDVRIITSTKETIPGEYKICPAQLPQTMSATTSPEWVSPDLKIYNRNASFPATLIEHSNTGNMGGYRIASFIVYPVQYNPTTNKLVLNSKMEIQISYKEISSLVIQKTKEQKAIFRSIVKEKVLNPEAINYYAPSGKSLSADTAEYVIITTDSFVTSFQPLADWKTKKGVPARIVTTTSIYSSYTGRDNQDKIRNFIKYANANWGTIWVLLGGQCDYENNQLIVPRRDVYYWTSGGSSGYNDQDTIPSDLYFSDLDGNWNNDGDAIWGEKPLNGDTLDYYSDVFLGRASVRTKAQVTTFVNKVLTYEKTPPSGYLKRIFLPSARASTQHDGTRTPDAISTITPSGFWDIQLYEADGNLTRTRTVDTLNSGAGFTHLFGHGNSSSALLYTTSPYLASNNIDTLKNGNKRGILNSSCCFVGAFDKGSSLYGYDCFAEHLLTASGGGVAAIMNSRAGWGDQILLYWSEALDTSFYSEVFYHNRWHLGEAHAVSKDNFVSRIQWTTTNFEYIWAWVIYELNLFGDPEMPMWTNEPGNLTITHNDTLKTSAPSFDVGVTSSKAPVESAFVCAMKSGEVYARGYTNASGNITLDVSPPASTPGFLYLTVTKHNYKPHEDTVIVATVGAEEQTQAFVNSFGVEQNYGSGIITFRYSSSSKIKPQDLKIYEISGRIVKTLTLGEENEIRWDASKIPAGIYFVKFAAGDYKITKKLILIR
ncbi:MAG: C25 family cysteine peptidase [bacterium]|nr:C25 family cysteine peptidase [bacterium]